MTCQTDLQNPSNPASMNAVDFIVGQFFGGNRAALARALDLSPSTLRDRALAGYFTSRQQADLLALSDQNGWGILPVHFFPERLAAADIPAAKNVTQAAA